MIQATAVLDEEATPRETVTPQDSPYRIVLDRLQRLVAYRDQLTLTLQTNAADQKSRSELVRVRHMIREVHRAVSLNGPARSLAQRIDPEAPAMPPPARSHGAQGAP